MDWPNYNLDRPSDKDVGRLKYELVYKCGATSGLTGGRVQLGDSTGALALANCKNDFEIGCILFRNQLQIVSCDSHTCFAKKGDSGSAVYLFDGGTNSLEPVGMVIKTHITTRGASLDTRTIIAYATPIRAIQAALKKMNEAHIFKETQLE